MSQLEDEIARALGSSAPGLSDALAALEAVSVPRARNPRSVVRQADPDDSPIGHRQVMTAGDHLEHVEVDSARQLHEWLETHHQQAEGVWFVRHRKDTPERYFTHDEFLDELVSFGWTDGIRRRLDDRRNRQLASPRRTQPWAKSYKDRAERLVTTGAMQPAGLASMQRARATGAWDAMNDVDALVVPDDLTEALQLHPPAADVFATFPPSVTRSILRWIASARTSATREKRLELTASEAQAGRKVKSHG